MSVTPMQKAARQLFLQLKQGALPVPSSLANRCCSGVAQGCFLRTAKWSVKAFVPARCRLCSPRGCGQPGVAPGTWDPGQRFCRPKGKRWQRLLRSSALAFARGHSSSPLQPWGLGTHTGLGLRPGAAAAELLWLDFALAWAFSNQVWYFALFLSLIPLSLTEKPHGMRLYKNL